MPTVTVPLSAVPLRFFAYCALKTPSAAVLGRQLPTSLRRHFSAASQVRQLKTPGTSASPVANIQPTGFLCCWTVGLELIAWQLERSKCHQRQLPQSADFWKHICSLCTEASRALEVFTKMRYTNILGLLTYLLIYWELCIVAVHTIHGGLTAAGQERKWDGVLSPPSDDNVQPFTLKTSLTSL